MEEYECAGYHHFGVFLIVVGEQWLAVRPYPCAGVVVVLDRDGSFDVLAADTFLPYCPEFCWFGEFFDGAWCEYLDVHCCFLL